MILLITWKILLIYYEHNIKIMFSINITITFARLFSRYDRFSNLQKYCFWENLLNNIANNSKIHKLATRKNNFNLFLLIIYILIFDLFINLIFNRTAYLLHSKMGRHIFWYILECRTMVYLNHGIRIFRYDLLRLLRMKAH